MDNLKDVEYLKFNVFLLRIAALLKRGKNKSFFRILLFYIWRCILVYIVWFTFVTNLMGIIEKRNRDFDESVMNYMYMGWRTNYYYYSDDKSENLIKNIRKIFKYESQTGFNEKNMSRIIKITKWMTITWFSLAFLISQSLIITEVIFGGYAKKVLPVSSWYPYDYTKSPYYEFTVFLQLLNQTAMIILVSPTDMFYASTCLMLSKQFEILSWEIKHLFYTNLLHWGISKETALQFKDNCQGNISIHNVIDNPKFHEDLLKSFGDIVRFHKALTSLASDVEKFFSPVVLMYFIPIAVIMIPFAYSIITTHDTLLFVEDFFSGSWFLFEVLFLSYFAELVAEKSEEIHDSLYEMPWYYCNRKFMNNFKIIYQRTHTPVTLTVGKFTKLGLNMFVWTLKTVYSFTTILRNMNQRT